MSKSYISPDLTVYGTVSDITAANATGDNTDADFPTDTPGSELTFGSNPTGDYEPG